MRVNRVIMSSDPNPLYCDFWNPLSKVYAEKFGITPTLAWLGTKEQAEVCGISDKYGEIVYVETHAGYLIPWQATWVTFWLTQFYQNDTILTMGIDQVPLSRLFLDMVENLDENDYAMLISDAYMPNYWTETASPTSYHIAKGSTYENAHQFDANFHREIEKVRNSGIKAFWETGDGMWGIDESYSCHNLRQGRVNVVAMDNFSLLVQRRIECERWKEPDYNINLLQQGWYSESHLCRPYSAHKEWIDKLFNDIPVCLG